jgi:imidazolonepropionase-like amidohydrolase
VSVANIYRFLAAYVLLACSVPAAAQDGPVALTNANLFDGVNNKIIEDATVFVRDGSIERIATGDVRISDDYEVIDAEGNYLMPGLFDVHTHIDSVKRAKQAIESGVTTVRSSSVTAFQDVALRELVRNGKIIGPEFVAAGIYITPDLGDAILADPRLVPLADGVNSDDELRPRQQVYTERQLRVIVDEAAKHGLAVQVHAHGDEGARAAVLAGARSIEHGTYLSDETLQLMKERGTWFVPTYVTMDAMNEERYNYVLRLRGKHMVPQLERAIREAIRIGVKIATGADHYYEEDAINRISIEVERFVEFGMSNFDALQTATVKSAALLQMDDRTGRIEEGFEADLILVPGNPLTNIEALQDVLLVMSDGRLALKRIPFGVTD